MVLMSIDVCSIEISLIFNHNRSFPFSTMRYYSHSTKSFVNKWFYSASTKQFICLVAFHVYKGLTVVQGKVPRSSWKANTNVIKKPSGGQR